MTPLGHAGIALLAGIGISTTNPNIDPLTITSGVVIGGVILDTDLFYRFWQKRSKVLDKTIGQHRFFPTHTPLFVLILVLAISLVNPNWAIFFGIGAMLHLLLDTLFFPEGINFTYPFNRKMTTFLTIKTHKFWAPKEISQVDGWWKNYFRSPLFWCAEVLPTIIAIVLLSLL